MNPKGTEDLGPLSIVVVDIGNTKSAVARWVEGEVEDRTQAATGDFAALREALDGVRARCANQKRQAIVIGSVVPAQTAALARYIEDDLNLRPFVVGDNTPLPVEVALPNPEEVGVDRVCGAAAAYDRIGAACVVVDVGTAVTINSIDNDGVFRGGAILPGLALQAEALHRHTAKLPLVEAEAPLSALGRDTEEAIASGLVFGLAGAIRGIVERIATESNAWPHTVLTGGGAAVMKGELDFIDSWAPDLCLMGIGLAYMRRVAGTGGGVDLG